MPGGIALKFDLRSPDRSIEPLGLVRQVLHIVDLDNAAATL